MKNPAAPALIAALILSLSACVTTTAQETAPAADTVLSAPTNTAVIPKSRPGHRWKGRDNLGWMERHEQILEQIQQDPVGLVFLGDSITHGFDRGGQSVWQHDFAQWNPVNMGFGGDKTEHLLWRIEHGTLDGISPKVAVVIIGTNNMRSNTPAEIAEGVLAVCDSIHASLPETKVLLLAIFPRGLQRAPDPVAFKHIVDTNTILAATDFPDWLTWLDIGAVFLDSEGEVNARAMPDYLHPNAFGYELWSEAMLPELTRLLNP